MYPLHSNPVKDVAVVNDRFGITASFERVKERRFGLGEMLMGDPWSGRTTGLHESASDFQSFKLNQRFEANESINCRVVQDPASV